MPQQNRIPLLLCLMVVLAVTARAARCAEPAASDVERYTAEFAGSYEESGPDGGRLHERTLRAAPATVPLLDGRPVKVWAYDGQVPGPTIRIRRGDSLRITLKNGLPQPTTIHWHGVRVPNAMDGVPGVTQPPVPPGGTFTYEFTPKDAGTFWFHPHIRSSEQVERGLAGTLIVEDATPPPYSRDIVWVLDDWLMTAESEITPQFNTRHDLAHDGRWGNVITVNGDMQAELRVKPGERLRLRLVNVANGRVFAPDFGALDAKVIAVDGMLTARPLDLKGFTLSPGNRLDVDLTVPRSGVARSPVVDRFTREPFRLAELIVDGAPIETPTFPAPSARKVPEWAGAERTPPRLALRLNARAGGPYGIQWTLNELAMDHDHAGHAHHKAYELPLGRFSAVRFTNESPRLHPMHIHGVFFKVLSRNGIRVDEPYWRDTVLVRARETVDVGLVPKDEGRWMVHCHILEHAESGMMTLVDVR